jgi:hypothetical protein
MRGARFCSHWVSLFVVAGLSVVWAGQEAQRNDTVWIEGQNVFFWSNAKYDETPIGGNRFVGRFTNDRVKLKREGLGRHRFLRLKFDLYVINRWDGDDRKYGPDIWQLRIDEDRTLVRTTFSNYPDEGRWDKQAYPGTHPHDRVHAQTGAHKINTLGYRDPTRGNRIRDAVYRFDLLIVHSSPNAVIEFAGKNLQQASNESWGLDNVAVQVLAKNPHKPLAPDRLKQCWQDLGDANVVKAAAAMKQLADRPTQTVRMFAARWSLGKETEAEVRRLICRLDHDDWRVREKAHAKLASMGPLLTHFLPEDVDADASPEVRGRLKCLRSKPPDRVESEQGRRLIRCCRLIDRFSEPFVRDVLRRYRDGCTDAKKGGGNDSKR